MSFSSSEVGTDEGYLQGAMLISDLLLGVEGHHLALPAPIGAVRQLLDTRSRRATGIGLTWTRSSRLDRAKSGARAAAPGSTDSAWST